MKSIILLLLNVLSCSAQFAHQVTHLHAMSHKVLNSTISGEDRGCQFQTQYFVTTQVKFPMCTGQTHQDLKNGMSIINLINSRGYLPTCRVMQLMLWMASHVADGGKLHKDFFVDIGANIGSCSVHMAALGFPVISVEPVKEHVETIRGSIEINPYFHIDLQHIGLSIVEKKIHANFGHGARNWGASEFHEVGKGENFEAELELKTFDQVLGHRKVALLKIDCEGCEWETLKSAKRSLKRIPMIKMELVQRDYTAGNETVTAHDIVQFLNRSNYEMFIDHWNEQRLYFGNHGNEVQEIDKLFGSAKFNLGANKQALIEGARMILREPINPETFNQRDFLHRGTDIIAIERGLSEKMKKMFLTE